MKIFLILFNIIMLIINFLVSPNVQESFLFFNILCLLISVIYFFVCLIRKKEVNIINDLLDIFVFLFLICTSIIPLIFKTYVSLNEQYKYMMECMNVLSIYLLVNNIGVEKNKIINILIWSTIPIIIIAFDRMYINFIWSFISPLFKLVYDGSRLVANFNYPNTLGIYLASVLILIFSKMDNTKSKINILYKVYSFILILLIFLTKSRATLILLFIFLLLYLLLLKDKYKRLEIVKSLIVSIFGVILYFVVNRIFQLNIMFQIIILLIILLLVFIFNHILNKYNNKLMIVNSKNIILVVFTFFGIILSYLIIALNFSKPIYIKDYNSFDLKINNDNSFKVKIDLNTVVNKNIGDNFIIEIVSVDRYRYQEKVIIDKFREYDGTKEYLIDSNENILYYILRVRNYNKDNEFVINKVYIDGKEYILNYRIIPNKVANIFNSISINEPSIRYRLDYYKDGLDIFKDSWLVGNGARSWNHLYSIYQSYNYDTREVHSFVFQILMDFGIVGFCLLVGIIIFVCYYFYKILKSSNKNNLGIFIAFFLLFFHTCIDFDMSFLLIMIYFFILISLISNEFKGSYEINNNFTKIFVFLFFSLLVVVNSLNLYGKIKIQNILKKEEYLIDRYHSYNKYINFYSVNSRLMSYTIINNNDLINLNNNEYNNIPNIKENLIESLITFINYEPYYEQFYFHNILIERIIDYIKDGNINEEYISEVYKILNNYKYDKFNINNMKYRVQLMINLQNCYRRYSKEYNNSYLREEANKLEELIIKEYENNIENLSNYKKLGISKREYHELMSYYKKRYNKWLKTI